MSLLVSLLWHPIALGGTYVCLSVYLSFYLYLTYCLRHMKLDRKMQKSAIYFYFNHSVSCSITEMIVPSERYLKNSKHFKLAFPLCASRSVFCCLCRLLFQDYYRGVQRRSAPSAPLRDRNFSRLKAKLVWYKNSPCLAWSQGALPNFIFYPTKLISLYCVFYCSLIYLCVAGGHTSASSVLGSHPTPLLDSYSLCFL